MFKFNPLWVIGLLFVALLVGAYPSKMHGQGQNFPPNGSNTGTVTAVSCVSGCTVANSTTTPAITVTGGGVSSVSGATNDICVATGTTTPMVSRCFNILDYGATTSAMDNSTAIAAAFTAAAAVNGTVYIPYASSPFKTTETITWVAGANLDVEGWLQGNVSGPVIQSPLGSQTFGSIYGFGVIDGNATATIGVDWQYGNLYAEHVTVANTLDYGWHCGASGAAAGSGCTFNNVNTARTTGNDTSLTGSVAVFLDNANDSHVFGKGNPSNILAFNEGYGLVGYQAGVRMNGDHNLIESIHPWVPTGNIMPYGVYDGANGNTVINSELDTPTSNGSCIYATGYDGTYSGNLCYVNAFSEGSDNSVYGIYFSQTGPYATISNNYFNGQNSSHRLKQDIYAATYVGLKISGNQWQNVVTIASPMWAMTCGDTGTECVYADTAGVLHAAGFQNTSGSAVAPGWLQFYGDGSDGPITINTSGAYAGVKWPTTWTCTGTTALTLSANNPLIIRATTSITIGAGCSFIGQGNTHQADVGGTGGGGGGGLAAGGAGLNSYALYNGSVGTNNSGGSAGGTTGGNAGNGTGISIESALARAFTDTGWGSPEINIIGGSNAGAGGSSGPTGGTGGQAIILIAPIINISSGATFNVCGTNGAASTGNNVGASGGGGGGIVLIRSPALTDSGGVFCVVGGNGGNIYNPAVVLSPPTGATTSTGTAAVAYVSAFSGGNPSTITVSAAGSGYNYTPSCSIVGTGGGANTGSGATCTVTMTGTSPNMTVNSIAVTGGNAGYGTGTTYTGAGTGGYGGNGWYREISE